MIKKIFFVLVVLFSVSLFADGVKTSEEKSGEVAGYSSLLVVIIGEELVARYGNDYACYLKENNKNSADQIMENIKNNELKALDCFNVVDYFGDENNKFEPNRDLNLELMTAILNRCNDIMEYLDKSGGSSHLILDYFKEKSILRYKDNS